MSARNSVRGAWIAAVGVAAVAAVAAGCAEDDAAGGGDLGVSREAIIGGSTDVGDPSVMGFVIWGPEGGWMCSGSVVSPRVVLTAAHCVEEAVEGGFADNGYAFFGTSVDSPDRRIDLVGGRYHRLYDPRSVGKNDVGVVYLDEDANTPPLLVMEEPIDGLVTPGATVRAVGYGVSDGMRQTGSGTKRQTDLPVYSVLRKHLRTGDEDTNTCQGDSGGPSFFTVDGQERIVGITSYGDAGCQQRGFLMRADAFFDEFIAPAIDAFDGPCAFDGTCVTDGCRSPDPDCDPCGPNGVCQEGCAQPDWDCPLGGSYKTPCAAATDCESRVCAAATDDPRIRFCSKECDPASVSFDCGSGMDCGLVDGRHVCLYAPPTPGAQGAACTASADCRSGLCHPDRYCVEECDPAAPACPGETECVASSLAPHVCALPSPDDGWCAAAAAGPRRRAPAAPWTLGAAVAALAALVAGRRRRRRRAG